jgi:hypothetical protein
MALTKSASFVDNFNELISFSNCYIKITKVTSTKDFCEASADMFKEKEGRLLTQRLINFPHDLEGPNPIKQAYLHLKTLPEFADAVDC